MAHTVRTASAHGPALSWTVLKDIRTRLDVWRSRRALAHLDATALKDIGVTASQAQREAGLGFWDVPTTWKSQS